MKKFERKSIIVILIVLSYVLVSSDDDEKKTFSKVLAKFIRIYCDIIQFSNNNRYIVR